MKKKTVVILVVCGVVLVGCCGLVPVGIVTTKVIQVNKFRSYIGKTETAVTADFGDPIVQVYPAHRIEKLVVAGEETIVGKTCYYDNVAFVFDKEDVVIGVIPGKTKFDHKTGEFIKQPDRNRIIVK